jgi:hypothetical protein
MERVRDALRVFKVAHHQVVYHVRVKVSVQGVVERFRVHVAVSVRRTNRDGDLRARE